MGMMQKRIRAKICGINTVEDAQVAIAAGADAIGLVFYAKSVRHVTVEKAAEIVASLPPFVDAVGLFVNTDAYEVNSVLSRVRLDLLQFHGEETAFYCQSFGRPYIKALRVRHGVDLLQSVAEYPGARALLFDTYQEGVAGGTGETFDWNLIPANLPKPVILAGGLTPLNVAEAIRRVQPFAVDVSGGVEREKGIKDADKIAAFMQGVLNG
jgi:phosphoribosylanthranilate isomerase